VPINTFVMIRIITIQIEKDVFATGWLRAKKQFCELHTENVIVADKCPCTCGNCHPVQSPLTSSSSSKVPTSVPTFQISTNEVPTIVTACIDNPNFSIFDDRVRADELFRFNVLRLADLDF